MKKNREFHTFRGYQLQKEEQRQMTASMEDYLEMIYRLSKNEGYVRVQQLADHLHVQAPSVTKIVQKLAAAGLLDYQKYGLIQLTEKGKTMGSFLLERHMVIENFLRIIGVDEELILKDTEMIEHHLSTNAVQKIKLLFQFMRLNPEILALFQQYTAGEDE
ncbi:MAG TPA: transcriptional regulator MntR [Bacillota bacterium]|nr:transcriptional regulator MntR [Bacillota bacterium]